MAEPVRVWIDTDMAIGVPGSDVDDGLALIQTFHSPELTVEGVSAVFGNAPLEKTWPLSREVCERFGPPGLAVFEGAASKEELGVANDAVRAIAEALERGALTIVALGPVTNVATVLQHKPALARQIDRIVMVAARRPGLLFFSSESQKDPFPDFNFECDPHAMQVLLDADIRLEFAPWEVSSHAWITESDLDALAQTGTTGAYIAERSRGWLQIWTENLGAQGFNPFDTLAIGWLTHPELFRHFEGAVWIDGLETGANAADAKPLLHVAEQAPAGHNGRRALYCQRPDPAFKQLLMARLAAPPGSSE